MATIPSAKAIPKSRPDAKGGGRLLLNERSKNHVQDAEKGRKLAICSGNTVNPLGSCNIHLLAYEIPSLDQGCPHLILKDHPQDL